jgi:hypothetical protein
MTFEGSGVFFWGVVNKECSFRQVQCERLVGCMDGLASVESRSGQQYGTKEMVLGGRLRLVGQMLLRDKRVRIHKYPLG